MSEEVGVQVGVRVRPFNQREKDLGAELCVEMDGPRTTLLSPPEEKGDDGRRIEPKTFTFDASFWSHDGFKVDKNGYCYAEPGSNYADQELVFNKFGKLVLDNAWQGYHCCLFAYGQTGAGKSYSMVGYGANRGIVPISCEDIFRRISENTDRSLNYEVLVSMVEIYNEQVQDLLIVPAKRPKKGLEIRESKQLGIFIDGVTKRPVDSYKSIEAVVEEGTDNRTVGSTLMNATSSRAHTVIVIEFKQVSSVGGARGEKVSLINLVDLAGSEKAGQTGASGDRLKEGCAINKSLSALGNVIEKLADKAEAAGKKGKAAPPIPYRDSKLTRLLQNALGGSSKTIMICAISPASSNHEETLSTLRYADRAKRIKNAAVVNENPQDKLIRQLREENMKLKELVDAGGFGAASPTSTMRNDAPDPEAQAEMLRKKEEIAQLEGALNDMQKSFADRLAEAEAKAAHEAEEKAALEAAQGRQLQEKNAHLTTPHIFNLNEDQLLTNKLHFTFPEGTIKRIGRSKNEDPPEIILAGPGIFQDHAKVQNMEGRIWLTPTDTAADNTFINGSAQKVSSEMKFRRAQEVELKHGDRVAFGQCMFVFVNPSEGTAEELFASGKISYDMARKEVMEVGEKEELEELKASKQRAMELEQKVKEAQRMKEEEAKKAEDLLKQREEEFKQRMEQMQREFEQSKAEAEAKAKEAEAVQIRAEEEARAREAEATANAMEAQRRAVEEQRRLSETRAEDAQNAAAKFEEQSKAAAAAIEEQKKAMEEQKRVMEAAEQQRRKLEAQKRAVEEEKKLVEQQARKHAQDLERMRNEFSTQQNQTEEAAQQRIKDLEKKAQKAAADEEDHRQREMNMRRLEEQLMVAMPLVKEANLIANELEFPYRLDTKMEVELTGDRARGSLHVSATVARDGVRVYEWALATLENRVYLMRELLQRCEDEGFEVARNIPLEEDPFWDPIEVERQIGVAQASLQGLLMQVENQHDCRILSTEVLGVNASRQDAERARAPHQVGSLRVEIWPCGSDGSAGVPDEEVVDEAQELLGTKMMVLVQVVNANGLPEELANDVRVEFEFFIDEAPHKVPAVPGYCKNPEFNYRRIFVQDPVTSRFMEYCDKKALVFRVYGRDSAAKQLDDAAQGPEAPAPLAPPGPQLPAKEQVNTFAAGIGFAEAPAPRSALGPEPLANAIAPLPPGPEPLAQAQMPLPGEPQAQLPPAPGPDPRVAAQGPEPPPQPQGPQPAKATTPSPAEIRREVEKVTEARDEKPDKKKKSSRSCVIS